MSKFFKKKNSGREISSNLRAFQSLNGLSLSKGFTLVETLVAISIFTASILGLMSVLASGISNTNYAKQKMIATYLAQEGIEYMRNMRDTFTLYDPSGSQTGWNSFNTKIAGGTFSSGTTICAQSNGNGCYFNDQNLDYGNQTQPMAGITVTACGSSCPTLLYDSTTGKYGYVSGSTSGFIRKIRVIQVSADETQISSTVYWVQGSGSYNVSFSEHVFNWE